MKEHRNDTVSQVLAEAGRKGLTRVPGSTYLQNSFLMGIFSIQTEARAYKSSEGTFRVDQRQVALILHESNILLEHVIF